MLTTDFPFLEGDFVPLWGISLKRLKSYREKGERGTDWEWVSNRVHWSEKFAAQAAGEFEVRPMSSPTVPSPAQTEPAPVASVSETVPSPAEPEKVRVLRVAGDRLLVAMRNQGDSVNVRVSDGRRFLPGMVMEARHIPGMPAQIWEAVGRMPRGIGRW